MKFEKIGNVAEFINGVAFKPLDWNGQGTKIIRIQNLTDPNKPYNRTNRKVDEKYVVRKGDVLVSWSATIDIFIWNDEDSYLNQHIFKVNFIKKKIDKSYFVAALKFTITDLSKYAHGATMKHLIRSDFENHKIPLPPIQEQKNVASILDRCQELIFKRKESIRLLDEFLKSTFLEMFGDPVRNEKGWEKVKLRDLCKIRRGASPRPISNFTGGNVPWIKIGDGTNGNELYIESTSEYITEDGAAKSVILNEGSLIFANCGVSLGFARILKIKGCIHDGWLSFEELNSELDTVFLLKLINHSTNYLRSLAPGGTQPNLNTSIMGRFGIILPPINQQNNFSQTVKKTEILRIKYLKSLRELENLFSSLSQKAFKGEMRI